MKRFIFALAFIVAFSGLAWGAPRVDTKTFFVDATASPVSNYERSGLTVYIPLRDRFDYHDGTKPEIGVNELGYGWFQRITTGYYLHPETGLITQAAVNEPRIEKRGGHYGMLLEPKSWNQQTYSEAFDTVAQWAKTRAAVSANTAAVLAPDGTATADYLYTDATAADSHYIANDILEVEFPDNTVFCSSVFAKAGGHGWLSLMVKTKELGYPVKYFDLVNGVVGGAGSGQSNYGMVDYGNGWYRCWITASSSSGAADLRAYYWIGEGNGDVTIDGDNSSGIYLWGAQFEQAVAMTSYMPTSAVTGYRDDEEENPDYYLPNGIFDGTSAAGTAIVWWYPQFDYEDIPQNVYNYTIATVRSGSPASLFRFHHATAPSGRLATIDAASTAPYDAVDWNRNTWYKLVAKWGYLDSGQSKFNVGFDSGTGIQWGGSPGDFTTYNTAGTKLEFNGGVAIAPYLVRDFMLFDRVLTDGEIDQLGSPQ